MRGAWSSRSSCPFDQHNRSAEIVGFLRTAQVLEHERLPVGTNRSERVTLARGAIRARAIFRVVAVRKGPIRLRRGEEYVEFFDRGIHEVAAYELARMLGLDTIPPTVLRTIDGQQGSLQLWVENSFTESERIESGRRPPYVARWRRQQAAMRVFDALVANTDRNSGNSLYDADWNLWMIDHTRAFQRLRGNPDFGGEGAVVLPTNPPRGDSAL